MLTRRELTVAAVAVLCALAALLLSGCAAPQVPKELPHYPCKKQDGGEVVYYACSDMEWVEQQITRKD